jgi:hypothetical protein
MPNITIKSLPRKQAGFYPVFFLSTDGGMSAPPSLLRGPWAWALSHMPQLKRGL